jgi:hypothetical protein
LIREKGGLSVMSTTPHGRRSILLLIAAVASFAVAVLYGVVLPLVTTSLSQVVFGLAFLVTGLVILAIRER